MGLTYIMDADHALPDGDEDLVLRDHADLGDGLPAEVLVGPEELDIRGSPGPRCHGVLEETPLGCADKQVVTITETSLSSLHLNVKLLNGIRMTDFVVCLFCIISFVK